MKSFAAILFLLCCAYPAVLAQPKTNQSAIQTQDIDVGGHKLRLQVAGSGLPTVVLDYGLGGSVETWNDVFPEVARFSRVVAYDRAGYYKSEPGPEPRSFTQIATELHTLLHRANIAPPYVLVGHSLGGANIRAFAHLFKDEVAGLVFVDPFNEALFASVSEQERAQERMQQEAALRNGPAGALGELKYLTSQFQNNFQQLRSMGAPPDVPIMLLVAGRDRPPRWVKSVLAEYGTWVAEASEGGLVVTADSGHSMQRDAPELVISAIRRIVFPSVQNRLARTIKEKGVDAAIALYRQMKERYPAEFLRENTLNTLGYQQLQSQRVTAAIALFKLNVEMYPNAFNTYDSLAESYMVHGERQAAIKNYRKSLALNPQNTNAIQMLKKLESTP